MTAPEVPIEVDPTTGHWSTDGLPMIYVPRHFFMGVLETIEATLGGHASSAHFYEVGYRAAFRWCEAESRTHGLGGLAVFHHYMRRLSQRGWGRFDGSAIDPETGVGVVTLRHSLFVAHFTRDANGRNADRKICGFCAGWAPGALAWVAQSEGLSWQPTGRESRCAAEGHDHCEFEISAS